jgi:hypothetical protein
MRATLALLACAIEACGLTVTGATTDPAPVTDAGPDRVVTLEAAPVEDAGAKPFCASLATPALFCDDFDTWPDAAFGWNRVTGTPQRTTSQFLSAPASLDAVVTSAETVLEKDFANVASSISVELDVRYAAIPAANPLSPIVIAPSSNGAGYLYLFVQGDRSYMQVSNDEYSAWQQPPPTAGAWHHVSASVTFSSTSTKFAGSLDGKAYDWSMVPKTKYPWQTPTTVTVRVGAHPYQATGEIFVDNVVVNAK